VKPLLKAMGVLAADLAATLLFLLLYAVTDNLFVSVGAGMVLGLAQIGWRLARREPIDALQWVSLFLILASGSAALVLHNPLFVMLKPSAIYLLVGMVMLKRGWMRRYVPRRALEVVPDLIDRFGTVWAGLMFASAALNLALALTLPVLLWGTVMMLWGIASKAALCIGQFAVMKRIGRRRVLSGQAA
jgi:intracellular septation protein A